MIRLPSTWLLVLVLTGCADYQRMSEVRISQFLTAEEIKVVKTASAEWCKASDATCLPTFVVERGANVVRLDSRPADWDNPRACASYHRNLGRIEFLPGCEIDINASLHELGHGIGAWGHIDEEGHVMSNARYKNLSCLTEKDVRFACDQIGCVGVGTCRLLLPNAHK